MSRREKLVFPGNPAWRLRIHPTSPLFNRVCATHGSSCPESSSLLQALHHVQDSWTADDRAAHPPWAHDLVDLCGPHQCDDLRRLFQVLGHKITIHQTLKPTISDEIAYLHGSKKWDAPWESPSKVGHATLVETHLQHIKIAYDAMENAGFLAQTAGSVSCGHPASAFGAGFSGFDRLDERGWDRAGYQPTEDHSTTAWELRTTYQNVHFIALGRIFQIPAGYLATYDPCSSIVDVVLLATLGGRAFRRGDPGLKALRTFRTPALGVWWALQVGVTGGKFTMPEFGSFHTSDETIWFPTATTRTLISQLWMLWVSGTYSLSPHANYFQVKFINTLDPNTHAGPGGSSHSSKVFWPKWKTASSTNPTSPLTFSDSNVVITPENFRVEAFDLLNQLLFDEAK
ncbi:hypothetical protein FB45DRAFT_914956 [Roridomyces roridus]|uniref:Uncharacterized protein n=1 Tax=Roridomyces roridus TaxID=1738132 RepID=A0AAD7BTH9_9AGAR|nr:hypothetical protein FB45DRAFT_914956 [Roridomyces roridus]